MIPCNHSVQPDAAHPERFEYGDHAIYSDDHGATWRLGGAVPSLKIDEAQVVELADGSILMNSRSHFGLGLPGGVAKAATAGKPGARSATTRR